jgi:hypothetical protein
MALTPTQEAQVLELINQQPALLSLANNEATITSKLAATKVNLGQLSPASSLADSDLMLVRQGAVEKSATGAVLKTLAQTGAVLTTGNQTIAGVKTFSSNPIIPNATASTHPVALGQFTQSLSTNGWQRLPSGLIIQWMIAFGVTANNVTFSITLPIAFPNGLLQATASGNGAMQTDATFGVSSNGLSALNVFNSSQTSQSCRIIAIGY